MMHAPLRRVASAVLLTAVAACGGGEEPADQAELEPVEERAVPEAPLGSVSIVDPTEGQEVEGPSVTVRLETDVPIRQAGDTTSGTGHHHLFLDADLSEPGMPVPTVPGSIIHMGDGSAEYTFEEVAPGEHRIIAVVADGLHIPLQPWVVDTVTFTVR
jgi:hypothetical protein